MIFTSADDMLTAGNDARTASRPHQRLANDLHHLIILQHTRANDFLVRQGFHLFVVAYTENIYLIATSDAIFCCCLSSVSAA